MPNDYTKKSRYPASANYMPPGYQSPSAVAPPYRRPLDAQGRPKPLLNMSLSEMGQFITGRPSASSRPATAKPPAAATTPPMQLVAPANARQQQMQLVAPANARQQMPTLPQPTVQSPSVNVPLPPSVYPDFLDNLPPIASPQPAVSPGTRMTGLTRGQELNRRNREAAAQDLRTAGAGTSANAASGIRQRMESKAAMDAMQREQGYIDRTAPGGGGGVSITPVAVSRDTDTLSMPELRREAFRSREPGLRGMGAYGGRPTTTVPGGLAGRERFLAGSSLDYGAGTGPVEQPPRRPVDMGTVVGYERAKDLFGPSIEPGSTQVTPNGTRVTVGLDTKDPFRALDGDSVLIGTQGRFGGPRRDGRPKQGPGGEYVPGGDLTTNEKFMAQRNRRRDRAQRAQEIMSMRAQMANTTTGRQAVGMGGNGFSPQMQYATTYQYNRPSLGQAAAMLDASRRRQQVADRADEQQAFNNQLAVVTAMPEGPERTQALSRLQSQMQPSSGEVGLVQPNPNTREGRNVIRQQEDEYTQYMDSLGEQGMSQTFAEIENPPEGISSVQQLLDSGLRPSDIMDAMESGDGSLMNLTVLQAIIDSPESSEEDKSRARYTMGFARGERLDKPPSPSSGMFQGIVPSMPGLPPSSYR